MIETRGVTHKHIYRQRRGAHTHTSQKGEALKGIRVEACWRGRLFCKTDVPQWAQAVDNLITTTGGTEQGTNRRDKDLLSDCHLGVRTKQLKLSLKSKWETSSR